MELGGFLVVALCACTKPVTPNKMLAIRIDRVVFLKAEVCFIAVPRFNPAKLLNRDVTLAQESHSVRCRTKRIVDHRHALAANASLPAIQWDYFNTPRRAFLAEYEAF
jgi:hypothetical protein